MATITKYEHCLLHYNDLLTEITEIPDYSITDDHTIQNCMRKRGDWTERMRQLRMDIIETRNLVTAHSISDYADQVAHLELKVNEANAQLLTITDTIKAADEGRGIYTDRIVKSCPRKLPGYAGLESEDFFSFKTEFLEAAKDHRIPRSEQPCKLREVLTGRAVQHLPRSCKDIDAVWEALEDAFGDPWTLLNHKLRNVQSMEVLTDAINEADPSYTKNWFLDYGAAVEDILELGSRSTKLAMSCFSTNTLSLIMCKLPFHVEEQVYDSELTGKSLLEEISAIIKSRRINAHRRAVGKNRTLIFSPSSPSPGHPGTTVRKRRCRRSIRPRKKAGLQLQPLMDVFIPDDIKSELSRNLWVVSSEPPAPGPPDSCTPTLPCSSTSPPGHPGPLTTRKTPGHPGPLTPRKRS